MEEVIIDSSELSEALAEERPVTQAETLQETQQYQENVLQVLCSIDTTLKYMLILALIIIGSKIAWWITHDLVIKHF